MLATPEALMAMMEDAATAPPTVLTLLLMLMGPAELYVWAALPAALMRPTASMTRVASPRREDW